MTDNAIMKLCSVTINHDGGERTIAGTLIGGNKPRIIEVQSIAVESDFPENLLYLRNYDKPGFIGALGALCGRHGLNIATFHQDAVMLAERRLLLLRLMMLSQLGF